MISVPIATNAKYRNSKENGTKKSNINTNLDKEKVGRGLTTDEAADSLLLLLFPLLVDVIAEFAHVVRNEHERMMQRLVGLVFRIVGVVLAQGIKTRE